MICLRLGSDSGVCVGFVFGCVSQVVAAFVG